MVLLPGTVLPLHVFEPRYRALVADCLAEDKVLGIATICPGPGDGAIGPPALFREVGVGRIVQHQLFRDGRSNIVVESVGRAAIVDEHPAARPYRVVRAAAFPERDPRGAGVDRLRLLVLQLGTVRSNAREEIRRIADLDDIPLVDALAARLLSEPEDRRTYLGRSTFAAQVEDVTSHLAALLTPGEPSAEA
ncbi:MAG: LON peptidase substrate-binding domain-containing protein [Deltaproteobacteria bacterium]|nr:LON peptidase substrate-binding domain-containing protein [Deltaproteobacteria bacterium]